MRHGPAEAAEMTQEVLCRSLESRDAGERLRCARRCSWHRHPLFLPALVACLEQEPDPQVVSYLVRAILSYRDASHRDRAIGFLGHADARIRARTVEGFWHWKDRTVLRAQMERLKDPSQRVRANAIVFFVMQDGREAQNQARALIQSDRRWVRLAMVYGLGTLRTGWALRELSAVAHDRRQPAEVVALAREFLPASLAASRERSPSSSAPDATVRTDLTEHLPAIADEVALAEALQDRDPLIRVHGLQNAPRFVASISLPILYGLVEMEREPIVLASLVMALAALGGAREAARIHRFLGHADPRVRANAVEALCATGAKLERPVLERLLADDSPRVRVHAGGHLFRVFPDEAAALFRAMVLGEDVRSRDSSFFVLSQLRDERVLAILKEALVDRRRPVYGQARDALQALAEDWPPAAELLSLYRSGTLVGPVVDGEPLSLILAQIDSPSAQDRIVALRKLAVADDPRVELMIELNLAARDPEVRAAASFALARRHRERGLPRLHIQLGRTYLDLTSHGHALVPHHLARELSRVVQEGGSEAEAQPGEPDGPDRVAWCVGRAIVAALDRDVVVDDELRGHCGDVRAMLEQVEASEMGLDARTRTREPAAPLRTAGSPVSPPVRIRSPDDRPVLEPEQAASGRPEPVADLARPAPAPFITASRIVHVLSLYVAFEAGRYWDGRHPSAVVSPRTEAETNVRLLDSLSLERDPAAFAQRFKGKRVSLVARVHQVDRAARIVHAQSGSIRFRIALDLDEKVPDAAAANRTLEFSGTIEGLDASHHVLVARSGVRPRP
jgi:HEAT repeat protein